MSRRKPKKPMLGGEIIIRCNQGHDVARVAVEGIRDGRAIITPLGGPNWQADTVTEVLAAPLTLTCVRCHKEGRRPDLRGSWEKVYELAAELEDNTERQTVTYVIGG